MHHHDIERVRVPVERAEAIRARLARTPVDRTRDVATWFARARQHGLVLTEDIAPSVHAQVAIAKARLGVAEPVLVVVQETGTCWNAHFDGRVDGAVCISLLGPAIDVLDDDALRSVIGHELGHALAHDELYESGRARSARWSLASELTADRFGMLAEPEPFASVRAQIASASGARSNTRRVDASAYARWCEQTVQHALARGGDLAGTTHPEHCVRVFAMLRFAQTDLFRELTGRGDASISVASLNSELERIVKIAARDDPSLVQRAATEVTKRAPSEPPPALAAERRSAPKIDRWTEMASLAASIGERTRDAALDAARRYVGRPAPSRRLPSVDEEPAVTIDPEKEALLARFAALERKLEKK